MLKNKTIYLAPLGLLSLTILTGAFLISSSTSATNNTDIVDEINIEVPVSCSIEGTGMNTHNASIVNGTYQADIGTTTLKAYCNDTNGFAIYAIGYTDNEYGKTVLTNTTLGSTFDIVTGTATSGNTSNWAMKLATDSTATYAITIDSDTNGSFSTYHMVPSEYTKVAHRDSGTDIGTLAIGASLTSTYAAYMNQTQPAGTYTGQVIYTLVHPSDGMAPHKPIYMQDLTSATIAQLLPNTNDTATVIDKRDEQEYTIAKLADGKYWMVENLNIAGGTALSSEDTDFDSSYTLPTTGNWTVSDGKLILPASSASGFGTNNYAYVYNSGNKEDCGADGQNAPCYSYYSWDTATLGSGRDLTTANTDAPFSICPKGWRLPTGGALMNDGWKRGDYYTLATTYGANLENSSGDYSVETGANFYNNAGPNTIPNFQISGYYFYNSFGSGLGATGLLLI